MTDPADPALTRARTLYTTTREELVRADAKATTLLSVVGLLLAALVAGAIADNWTPRELALIPELMFWAAIVAGVAGEADLLLAVLPHVEHDRSYTEARYFGHVVQMQDRAELRSCLDQADTELDQATDQIWWLSKIVDRKYAHVRRGMQLFAAGVGLAALALLLDCLVG